LSVFRNKVAVAFFFGAMTILEGKGISEAQDRISAVRQNLSAFE